MPVQSLQIFSPEALAPLRNLPLMRVRSIETKGTYFAYGPIPRDRPADHEILRECAFEGSEVWRHSRSTIEFDGKVQNLVADHDQSTDEVWSAIFTASACAAVAVWSEPFYWRIGGSGLSLNAEGLSHFGWDDDGYWLLKGMFFEFPYQYFDALSSEMSVVEHGTVHRPEDYEWCPPEFRSLVDRLLQLQRSVAHYVTQIVPGSAFTCLRDSPGDWAQVIDTYTAHYGPTATQQLLTPDELTGIRNGDIAIIRQVDPVSQLLLSLS